MNELSDKKRYRLLFRAGVILTVMIGYGIYSNIDSLGWFFVNPKTYRQTTGQVLSSSIESGGMYGGWRFNIIYRYKVGNQEFVSDRVHFGYQAMSDRSYAESYIEKYPVGKQVVVFYQQGKPENSVLEPEITWNGLLDFYLILTLLPITILSLATYFFVRSHQQGYLKQSNTIDET